VLRCPGKSFGWLKTWGMWGACANKSALETEFSVASAP